MSSQISTLDTVYAYSCKDYPGMENCPGHFVAATEAEIKHHMEMHAREAHGEDPTTWSDEDWAYLETLIKSVYEN
jgi:predicted small metal-binding protein